MRQTSGEEERNTMRIDERQRVTYRQTITIMVQTETDWSITKVEGERN